MIETYATSKRNFNARYKTSQSFIYYNLENSAKTGNVV